MQDFSYCLTSELDNLNVSFKMYFTLAIVGCDCNA